MARVVDGRIIVLCHDLHETGGIGAVTRRLVDALEREGRACEVWSLGAGPQPPVRSVPVRYAMGQRRTAIRWAIRATFHDRIDAVVCMHLHLAPLTLPMSLRGIPVLCFLHGIEGWTPLSALRAGALRQSRLVANSETTRTRFLAANPSFRSQAIAVCPLGVDDVLPVPRSARERYALIVGRMIASERYKGHDPLLDIWPRLVAQVPDAHLVIAGDGDDRARLFAKAEALGVGARVRFVGRVDDSALRRLYNDCIVFVMPSTSEGFGLAYLESMRAARPCIGSPGAAEEIIRDGVTGHIIAQTDSSGLEYALVRLFSDERKADELGRAGRARFLEEFTAGRFGDRMLRLIEALA